MCFFFGQKETITVNLIIFFESSSVCLRIVSNVVLLTKNKPIVQNTIIHQKLTLIKFSRVAFAGIFTDAPSSFCLKLLSVYNNLRKKTRTE